MVGILFLAVLLPASSFANQDSRTALVIGNGAYRAAPLKNPANDAQDIAAALKDLGFSVTLLTDADQRTIEEGIRQFGKTLRMGGVGLFYYAGHGLQVQGRNYLIPVGARIQSEIDVKYEAVDAGRVLAYMEEAENVLNIVILDACRDNPFARSFRSAGKGLAKMDAPTGSYLAYSTAPGSVAADGSGRNGLYTSKLLNYIKQPGLELEKVFKKVRIDVARSSGNKQIPWDSSSLMGDFYFSPKRGIGVVTPKESIKIASGSATVTSPAPVPAKKPVLAVESNVDGARVFVDGRLVGTTPFYPVEVSEGEHRILAEKEGYDTYRKRETFARGRTLTMYVELSETAPVYPGWLYIDTIPEYAHVRIVGINSEFFQGIELSPAEYQVEISADGHQTKTLAVTVKTDEENYQQITLSRHVMKFRGMTLKLAIFPWKLLGMAESWNHVAIRALKKAIIEAEKFTPVYSYYDLGEKFVVRAYDKTIINDDVTKKIWVKERNITTDKLNHEYLWEIAGKVNADAILLGHFAVKAWDPDPGKAKIYLINTRSKVIYESKYATSDYDSYGSSLCYKSMKTVFNAFLNDVEWQ